ncbi:MAG: hypothetical protein WD847_18695 [Pirellulales bacterium]
MIIWSGKGFWIAVITFGCLLLAEFTVEAALDDDRYYQEHGWPKAAGLLTAASIVWVAARSVNRETGRVLIDVETGEEVTLRPAHSLFFVPFRHWPWLLGILASAFLFV